MSENLIYVCVVCTVVGGLTAVEWVGIPEYRPWCCRAFPWFQPLSLPSLGSRICELGMYASPRAIALCWLNRSGRRRSRCASLSRADVKACAAPWFSDLATVCWLAFAELLSWWLANHSRGVAPDTKICHQNRIVILATAGELSFSTKGEKGLILSRGF